MQVGARIDFPDGITALRVKIVSHGASSITLLFSDLMVPPGADLWVYSPELAATLEADGESQERTERTDDDREGGGEEHTGERDERRKAKEGAGCWTESARCQRSTNHTVAADHRHASLPVPGGARSVLSSRRWIDFY